MFTLEKSKIENRIFKMIIETDTDKSAKEVWKFQNKKSN